MRCLKPKQDTATHQGCTYETVSGHLWAGTRTEASRHPRARQPWVTADCSYSWGRREGWPQQWPGAGLPPSLGWGVGLSSWFLLPGGPHRCVHTALLSQLGCPSCWPQWQSGPHLGKGGTHVIWGYCDGEMKTIRRIKAMNELQSSPALWSSVPTQSKLYP